jgi:hypothetical protein
MVRTVSLDLQRTGGRGHWHVNVLVGLLGWIVFGGSSQPPNSCGVLGQSLLMLGFFLVSVQ